MNWRFSVSTTGKVEAQRRARVAATEHDAIANSPVYVQLGARDDPGFE
jgi:hypothetical protein